MKNDNVDNNEVVVIHDSVRPMVTEKLIRSCIENCKDADGVLPVLNVKDTTYICQDGKIINLLERSTLYSGQTPESFIFGKYYDINLKTPIDELNQIKGSSEIAFINGLIIKTINGDERNFKITTPSDLDNFKTLVECDESI